MFKLIFRILQLRKLLQLMKVYKNRSYQGIVSSAHQLLFILFFYMPWYFLQWTLNNISLKLQRAHKKIITETKFWCLTVSRASFTKTGGILENLCSFFWNIVTKWNSNTEKITLMKNYYLHSKHWNSKDMTFLKKWIFYTYFTQFFTEKKLAQYKKLSCLHLNWSF